MRRGSSAGHVAPPFRGRGLGTAVLKALEPAARELGYQVVRIDCPRANWSVYLAAGFREIADYNNNPQRTFGARSSCDLGRRRAVVLDPAGCRHGQGGDRADQPTCNGCRNAQLKDGKPSSCRIGEQADDQPNNPSDHTPRGGRDGRAPFG